MVDELTYIAAVERLVEDQGTDEYVALVLDELGVEFVEDVPARAREYLIARAVALAEEEET